MERPFRSLFSPVAQTASAATLSGPVVTWQALAGPLMGQWEGPCSWLLPSGEDLTGVLVESARVGGRRRGEVHCPVLDPIPSLHVCLHEARELAWVLRNDAPCRGRPRTPQPPSPPCRSPRVSDTHSDSHFPRAHGLGVELGASESVRHARPFGTNLTHLFLLVLAIPPRPPPAPPTPAPHSRLQPNRKHPQHHHEDMDMVCWSGFSL